MSPGRSQATRIGTAGWSYPDWRGVVYPKNPGRAFDPLRYLAAYVPAIEINSTFYQPPKPSVTERWAGVVHDLPRFRFTAKLYRGFTDQAPPDWSRDEVQAYLDGCRPLADAGVLAALLVQFPFYFDARYENLRHLATIAKVFAEAPLVLEVRHRSFVSDENLRHIEEMGFSFCNIDQPQARTSIAPAARVTGRISYLRLHGRNAEAWFSYRGEATTGTKRAGRDEKYDYLYSAEELSSFARIVRSLEERTDQVFVIANNHFAGKGLVNALELTSMLDLQTVEVPPSLVREYPRLASRCAGQSGRSGPSRPDASLRESTNASGMPAIPRLDSDRDDLASNRKHPHHGPPEAIADDPPLADDDDRPMQETRA